MAERNGTLGKPAYADARGRYRLDERIASGGMGEVWRATDTVLDREVAVKLLRQEHADDVVFRTRFETEAQHAAGLDHPGVARVFDFGAGSSEGDGRPPYLVMEYVDGKPLSALLRPGSRMQPAAAAALLAEVGDALGAAHARGIVHRDVKPGNILVTADRHVKITDFGIARAVGDVALTRTGEVLGTPQYISPEQAQGSTATPASDVYALGAVAFECLAGRRPFVAESPVATALAHLRDPVPELPDTVPPALAAVVQRALAKDPAERYADGAALASALRAATADSAEPAAVVPPVAGASATRVMTTPAAAAAAGGVETQHGRLRRIPLAVWAAAAAFVLILAVAAIAAVTAGGAGSPAPTNTPHTPATTATVRSTPPSSAPSSPPGHHDQGNHGQGKQGDEGQGNHGQGNQGNGEGDGNGAAVGHAHGKGHQ